MHGRFVRKRRISTEFLRESKLLLDEKPGHNMLIRGKVKIISFFATKKKKKKEKKNIIKRNYASRRESFLDRN